MKKITKKYKSIEKNESFLFSNADISHLLTKLTNLFRRLWFTHYYSNIAYFLRIYCIILVLSLYYPCIALVYFFVCDTRIIQAEYPIWHIYSGYVVLTIKNFNIIFSRFSCNGQI